jgi:YcxB-like protein
MEQIATLRFAVTYRLNEYLEIARSHTLATATPKDASKLQQLTTRLIVTVVGTTMFLIKSYRIGTCHFRIDREGIRRRSKQGEMSIQWRDVTAVHKYGPGYLIEMAHGGIPIPFRVLSKDQSDRLHSMIARRICMSLKQPPDIVQAEHFAGRLIKSSEAFPWPESWRVAKPRFFTKDPSAVADIHPWELSLHAKTRVRSYED